MQSKENMGSAQTGREVAVEALIQSAHKALLMLLEVHMGLSASLGCAYGVVSLVEEATDLEMDSHTEMAWNGLKYSLEQTDEVREEIEAILTKAIRPFLPPPPLG